ncbi:adenosine deaminase 2-like isoform X4 [Palaemon carinicauda]|uniref:adenosine deaminase 2-like isoform X4 n=1 Tax=Palaemon carinicauda TaxID=392227 RepID=UPI0035B57EA3
MGLGVFRALVVYAAGLFAVAQAIDENSTYWQERQQLLANEQITIMGQDQILNADEQAVNEYLMQRKMAEMDASFSSLHYLPAKNFLLAREEIEQSDVYKFLKLMPKGAALHLHDTAMATVSWVVSEISYWDNLYMCFVEGDQLLLKFMATPDTVCNWTLVSDKRASYPSPKEFDRELQSRLSIVLNDPQELPDINAVWKAFESTLIAMTGMVMYRPAWEAYLSRALLEFMEDNVLHVEFRGTLPRLYELDGSELTEEESLKVYQKVSEKFLTDHRATYFGTRYIYAPLRRVDNITTIWSYVQLAKRLQQECPNYLAGFDLVGQEDLGLPLKDILDPLLTLSEGDVKVPAFYHAGETTWMGMSTDENLIDALLLNATRIGHGYAITKHPKAKKLALEKGVPLEICPISNQVLMLISDLRNHPAAGLISEGFPVVVSADDPGTWGAVGLSHDFYEAFMALGGAKADLRFLKQLAINSIKYSSLDNDSKEELMKMWQQEWDVFIEEMKRLINARGKLITPTFVSVNTTSEPVV